MLATHPEVYVPASAKELHYFDREVLRHGWDWYVAHFQPGATRPARGEFTPDYARLRPEAVKAIARLLPELRLIFVIRDPVERTISQLRNFTLYRRPHARTGELLRHVVERRSSRLRNDYLRTIECWSRAFGPDSLLVVLYDELCADPVGVMATVAEHLGVDPAIRPPAERVSARVSVRADRVDQLAHEELIRWYLARMWLEPTRALDERLGGRVSHWIAAMEQQSSGPLSWRAYRRLRQLVLFPPWDMAYSLHDRRASRRISSVLAAIAPPS